MEQYHCDPESRDWYDNTPLLEACRCRCLAVVEVLLTTQDCSTVCNNVSRIPLHYSCRHGWLDVTRRLVEEYHCDPESGDWEGDTPLQEACREGHVNIVRYLVSERGCSTACHNKNGNTPLHGACREGRVDIVRYLVSEVGCRTAYRNKNGNTPMHEACRWNKTEVDSTQEKQESRSHDQRGVGGMRGGLGAGYGGRDQ